MTKVCICGGYEIRSFYGYTLYVDPATKRVHHAVNHEISENTLYPYRHNRKEGGYDNASGYYTVSGLRAAFLQNQVIFK